MGIIAWIVLGLVVGLIADRVMGSPRGIIVTTVIGIAGALLGGFIANKLFHVENLQGFFNISTWITAFCGAIVLLAAMRLLEDGLGGGRRRGLRH